MRFLQVFFSINSNIPKIGFLNIVTHYAWTPIFTCYLRWVSLKGGNPEVTSSVFSKPINNSLKWFCSTIFTDSHEP